MHFSLSKQSMATKKVPLPLTLHVEQNDVKASAFLVSSKYFDEGNADSSTAANDNTMIWCAGLLSGRSSIPEASTMRRALPPSCSVDYYQPTHEDNPTRIGRVNDFGEDDGYEGQWACVLQAPTLENLADTFDAFTEHYMGLGAPMRDNFFRHERASHKFISRKNRVGENFEL